MPDHKIVALSDLDDAGLRSLALLHQSVMQSLLTDLGLPFILRYYRIARMDESVIGYCVKAANSEVIGWVVGSPDPTALNAKLRTPLSWFAGQILRVAITRPPLLWQLWVSLKSASQQNVKKDVVELTYLGIAADARGSGLGRFLLEAFTSASRAAGYKTIELSVEKENSAAVGLYSNFGFVQKRTLREGRFQRRRMAFIL